jgi:exopolysaccharide biosynthesis protein
VIKKSGTVTIERLTKAESEDAQVIAGNVLLVSNGKPVNHPKDTARHPRTVVGLDPGGTRLTILMVDGRRKGVADGMTCTELSKEMIQAGCDRALNLDGGGSSIMLLRQGDKWVTKNVPSESERPVASVLGIDIKEEK